MANIKSALKSLRKDAKKNAINKAVVSELRTITKKARLLIGENKREEADTVLKKLESKLSRAAKHNVIKKGNASRHIS
ncbi:MAG: 30S ribosomal protein S20, partial [Candidatus Omnitrophota bacterium]